jgi:hypothetical protein
MMRVKCRDLIAHAATEQRLILWAVWLFQSVPTLHSLFAWFHTQEHVEVSDVVRF